MGLPGRRNFPENRSSHGGDDGGGMPSHFEGQRKSPLRGLWAGGRLLYGLFIYLTGRLASGEDGLSLGIWQMGFMGLLNGISAQAAGEITMPSSPEIIGALLALTLLCSAFGFTFQTVAQQFISTEEAGLFSALDPLFATMWGMIFRGENPGLSGAAGALLVLLGMAGAQDGLLFKIRMKFRFLMKSTLP